MAIDKELAIERLCQEMQSVALVITDISMHKCIKQYVDEGHFMSMDMELTRPHFLKYCAKQIIKLEKNT